MKKFVRLSAAAGLCLTMALGSISCYGKTKTIGTSTSNATLGLADGATTETTTVEQKSSTGLKTENSIENQDNQKEETTEKTTEEETETTTAVYVMPVLGNSQSGKNSVYFTDVNSESFGWAVKFVDDITGRQIASGVGNNKFNPGGTIIRGDFAVFLSRTLGLKDVSVEVYGFSDVKETDYYNQYIANCNGNNIFDSTRTFFPEVAITRGDAMLYIYRGLLNEDLILGNGTTDCSMYTDGSEITNVEMQLAVGTLTKMGIVSGNDGKLNLNDTMNRAEMATIFSQTCTYLDKAKAVAAEKQEAQKEKEEAEKEAEQQINGNDYKSAKITETKSFDGEDASFANCTMDFASQKDSILTMANGNLSVNASTIKSYGYDAVALKEGGKAQITSSTVSASEANGVNISSSSRLQLNGSTIKADGKVTSMFGAVVKGGTLDLEESVISTDKFSSISLLGGSVLNIKDSSKVEVNGKGVSAIVVQGDDVSDNETDSTNTTSTEITVDNSKIITNKASLLQLKDCVASVVLSNSEISCDSVVNYDQNKVDQTYGSTLNLTLKNQELNGDIITDYKTNVNLHIGSGSVYKGSVDTDCRQMVNIELDSDGKLMLSGTSYVNKLILEDTALNNIDLGGNILYYNKNNPANDYLAAETYTLGSGEIVPFEGNQE